MFLIVAASTAFDFIINIVYSSLDLTMMFLLSANTGLF